MRDPLAKLAAQNLKAFQIAILIICLLMPVKAHAVGPFLGIFVGTGGVIWAGPYGVPGWVLIGEGWACEIIGVATSSGQVLGTGGGVTQAMLANPNNVLILGPQISTAASGTATAGATTGAGATTATFIGLPLGGSLVAVAAVAVMTVALVGLAAYQCYNFCDSVPYLPASLVTLIQNGFGDPQGLIARAQAAAPMPNTSNSLASNACLVGSVQRPCGNGYCCDDGTGAMLNNCPPWCL